jgi:hypothetical protein
MMLQSYAVFTKCVQAKYENFDPAKIAAQKAAGRETSVRLFSPKSA